MTRTITCAALRWLAFVAVACAVAIWMTGGWAGSIGGLHLSLRSTTRPFEVALLALTAHGMAAGFRRSLDDVGALLTSRVVVVMLVAGTIAQSVVFNSRIGGGSDSYGYLSQAELWLTGPLVTPMPAAATAPWPDALQTFTPLAYVPAAHDVAIAPLCPPGFPLMLAAAARVAGRSAMFAVVPICGGVLVWMTYLIGVRVASKSVGVGASWLVATSPAMVNMLMSPMSDVPAAAAWAVATYQLLGESVLSSALAGLAAGAGIMIRPSLAPIAAGFAAWLLWPLWRTRRAEGSAIANVVAFVAGSSPGVITLAYLNREWYGSALKTGYGDTSALFSLGNTVNNALHYSRWISETQTPIVLAGLLILFLPLRQVWGRERTYRGASLLAVVSLAVMSVYLVYKLFDAWWFLRFLLPVWPALFIGSAFLLWRLSNLAGRSRAIVYVVSVASLGLYGVNTLGNHREIYEQRASELKYVAAAQLVRGLTEPSSVILSMQESGSLRFYGGRTTLRYDLIGAEWLDRTLNWLDEHNAHPYVLLEQFELQDFVKRFGNTSAVGRLRREPVLVYEGSTMVYLYDLAAAPASRATEHITSIQLAPEAFLPQPLPRLSPR